MTVKISISLPDEVHALVECEVAAGRASSMSAFIADAISAHTDPRGLRKLLDDLDSEFGPVSTAVRRETDVEFEALFGLKPRDAKPGHSGVGP